MKERVCAFYILANRRNTVLYTGVTSDLQRRLWQHQSKTEPRSFTARYNVKKLVWFETTRDITAAIVREKQIKSGSRAKKVVLVESMNPEWRDLSEDW